MKNKNIAIFINIFFGATFLNHLHILSFFPQHNRPLLLFLFPIIIIFIYKNNIKINKNFLLWLSIFLIIVTISTIYNFFYGSFFIYPPELLIRALSYLIVVYFFIIGIIFYDKKKFISVKFYYLFMIIGFVQMYAVLGFPGSSLIINLFDNYLIDSFFNPGNRILFLEAEPSYIAYFIIFILFFFDQKGKSIWLFFSLSTVSIRTTIIGFLLYIKKHPITLSLILIIPIIFFVNKYEISNILFDRIKNIKNVNTMDPSTYIRYVKNDIAFKILNDNYLIGVGPGQYSTYYSGKYLNKFETRGIWELESARQNKSKTEDPYSLILGLGAELGLIGLICFFYGLYKIFIKTNKKYYFLLIILIFFWDYPYGKPYMWILLGYLFAEAQFMKNNKLIL